MNPNENPTGAPQMPPRPQQPAQQMPPRQAAPQQPYMPPQQQPQGANATQGVNGFADSMGHGHVKMGNYKVDYASIVTAVGAVLTIISVFIPFFSSRFGSASLMTTFGFVGGAGVPWLILLSAVAICVLAVCRQTAAALTATIYTTIVVLFMVLGAGRTLVSTNGISYSFGMYLMIIAVIVMLVGTITSQYNAMRAKKGTFTPLDTTPQPAAQYANNGWQFGVPAPTAPSSADRSNWQFGVPNAPTATVDGMPPMPQRPAQPATGTFPAQPAPMPQQPAQPVSYSQQTQYTAATPQASVTVESDQQGAVPFQQPDIPPVGGDAASNDKQQ